MSLNDLDIPLTGLEAQVAGWVEEVVALRHDSGFVMPPPDSAPHVITEALLNVRARMDRIEYLMTATIRARGRVTRAAKVGRYTADDAWDRSIASQHRAEYQGPKERYSRASLASYAEQREARQAERLQSVTEEAYEAIRVAHSGMSSLRYDLVAWLRSFAFESNLER